MGEDQDDATRTARMDVLIIELRALREAAGISYRELAARITAQREAAGMPSAAARIALSTVSDMFRLGRARINVNLLAEVARVLENDPTAADRWRERAITAMSTITDSATAVPVPGEPVPASFSDRVAADPFPVFAPLRPTLVRLAMLVLGGLLLNATGKFFNPLLGDVLFLDMIGTALVALLAGPWSAAAVGVIFVCVELLKSNLGGALFALTMISAGLIWGYGVRRGASRSLARFLWLSAVVAVATTAIAVPISMLYFGGATGRGLEGLYGAFSTWLGLGLWTAVAGVNLVVSIIDKVLTGAIAFGLARLVRPVFGTAPARRFIASE